MSDTNDNWIQSIAIGLVVGLVVSAAAGLFLGLIFVILAWSLSVFGINMTITQFIASIIILFVLKMVISYLTLRGK